MNTSKYKIPRGFEPDSAASRASERDSCTSCALKSACLPRALSALEILGMEKAIAARRRVPRHTTLINAGERFATLYAVRFGQFKVCRVDQPAELQVLGFQMPGDMLGLSGIATGRYPYSVVALDDSEVCEIPYQRFEGLLREQPALQRNFLQTMSREIVDKCSRASFLCNMRADRRFASFLLYISTKYAQLGYSERSFRLSMSRGDIGSYLGITVESISRLIARFTQNGWIRVNRRNVEILARDRLEALSRGDDEVETTRQPSVHAVYVQAGPAAAMLDEHDRNPVGKARCA